MAESTARPLGKHGASGVERTLLSLVPMMARHTSAALASLSGTFALLAFASVGQAQLTVTVNQVDGAVPRTLLSRYVFNKAECDGGAEIDLTIANIPVGTTVLDFWSGTDCYTVAARTPPSGTCVHINFPLSVSATASSATFASGEVTVPNLGGCNATATGGESLDIYILAMTTTPGGVEDVGLGYGMIATTFDVVPPTPPTGVTGGSGNTSVPVTWTGAADTEYDVYVSTTGTSAEGGACGGTPTQLVTTVSTASADLDPSTLGLAVGESRSVAVVARDKAKNESALSAIACITRVETCGYLCKRGEGFSTCSAVPGASRSAGAVGGGLLATALALLLVRARRNRSVR